jgi:hypothetical protein
VAFVNKSFMTTLATTGTALLSLSFVFATTCQEVLGSCIFLFVKHPFDIGDRVDISSDQLIVERISLLYTVFRRVQSGKVVQVPNIVLNTLWIDNITRSKAMREQISVFCAFDTSFEDVTLLKRELQKFVQDKENNRDFQPDLDVEVLNIAEMNKLELKVEIRHKSNWANESIRAARRSKFMCALVMALRKVPIYAPGGGDALLGSSDRPSYSVSLSPDVAQVNRNTFTAAKEAKRMAVSSATTVMASTSAGYSTGVQSPGADYLAVQNLHSRNVALDPLRDETWKYARTEDGFSRSSLDETATVNDGTASEKGLLREQSKTSLRGKRGANQTLDHTSSSTSSHLPYSLPPRGQSNVNYAHPPMPSHNHAAAMNVAAMDAVNAQTVITNNTMAAAARSDVFNGGTGGPSF